MSNEPTITPEENYDLGESATLEGPSGTPATASGELDLKAKKAILRTFPYGLYALTSIHGEDVNVFTATWVCQCSFEPPLIMAAVRKDSHSHDMIREGRVFGLNQVRKSDQQLLGRFFKTVRRIGNKLEGVSFHPGQTGAPILDEALSALECQVVQFHEAGDHSVVIGQIVAAHLFGDENPLVCGDTSWHYAG